MRLRLLLASLLVFSACSASADELPAKLLDLSRWKLTLPYDTDRPGEPDEVLQPELGRFVDATCFYVAKNRDAVVFRAACDGHSTDNSKYPRTELREMKPDGEDEAKWSTKGSKTHSMELELAITHMPRVKQHVVCAQIHDDQDDLLMVRLEDHKLFIERSDGKNIRLDSRYELGDKFTLRLAASGGRIKAWYNGQQEMDWKVSKKKCFFKAGCYTQSNLNKEKQPGSYGEVAIYRLELKHTD